jgi:hypothetical protein
MKPKASRRLASTVRTIGATARTGTKGNNMQKPRRVRRLTEALTKDMPEDEVLRTLARRAAELAVIGEMARRELLSNQHHSPRHYSSLLSATIRAEALARRAHNDFTKAVRERLSNAQES